MKNYQTTPDKVVKGTHRDVHIFSLDHANNNIDKEVVKSFGDEWEKFESFEEKDLERTAAMYFDILDERHLNKNTYAMDMGCGTGRWTKIIADKVAFVEAVDPSSAIFVADKLLKDKSNIRLTQASVDTLPFADNTFDFVMSIGVLHHIPDTQKAMSDCVKKVKKGGFFYTYLYYSLDNKGFFFKTFFGASDLLRKAVSKLPSGPKKAVCDGLAVVLYMPFVGAGRLFRKMGFKKLANRIPLSIYQDQPFYIIRNDSLDRFGTKLEQRFSRIQVAEMMAKAGLKDIVVSPGMPYWHAVGTKM
ncbi:MAG: class I SAM-dependent methyltransferase [Chitinophagaceae bacterium]|nr:class I SAM-dependent methyltransferase [Chitinophagaceae bacterium]